MLSLTIAIVLAVLLGFSAHRASVCMVRAVSETMSARTGYMLASIGKSILWIIAVTVPFFWLMPAAAAGFGGWQLTATAVFGGFLFGIGAGINGACAYSTMARLVDGEGAMLVTVAGFAVGVLLFAMLAGGHVVTRPVPNPALIGSLVGWAALLSLPIWLWALYEAVRLWRTRPADATVASLVLAKQYRLSSAALLIGLTGAAILLLFGTSGYTSTFELVIEGLLGTRSFPSTARWALLLAVLAGMFLSTWQRGSFRIDLKPRRAWLRNIFGGILMGFGVALAPGGNDVLVLYAIPSLSPHALPTFAAMTVGIVAALVLMRAWFRVEARVQCKDDLYISDSGLRDLEPTTPVQTIARQA